MEHIIYHNADQDGFWAASVVALFCSNRNVAYKLYGVNYGDQLDVRQGEQVLVIPSGPNYARNVSLEFKPGDSIHIVDFCFQPEAMKLLAYELNGALTWCDHHRTNEDVEALYPGIAGLRRQGTAACVLAWEFYFKGEAVPKILRVLGQYDVWNKVGEFDWYTEVLAVQTWAKENITGPVHENTPDTRWAKDGLYVGGLLLEDRLVYNSIKEKGAVRYKVIVAQNAKTIAENGFELEWEDKLWLACNRLGSSQLFEAMYDEKRHYGMLTFVRKNKLWVYNLYTTHDVDLTVIAKKYGGGGHKKACGFQTEKLILTI